MYSQRLINLETRTQENNNPLYSDRLLNLEKVMEQQKSTNKSKTPEREKSENNTNIKDEPIDEFLDDLLADTTEIAKAAIKKEEADPNPIANNDEEIDPSFFDEILTQAEKENTRVRPSSVFVPIEGLKRERSHITVDNQNDASKKKSKKGSSKNDESVNTIASASGPKKPRLQIRTDLGLFRTAVSTKIEASSSPKPRAIETNDPVGESLLFMDFENFDTVPEEIPEKTITPKEKLSRALETVVYARRAFEKAKKQKEKKFYHKNPVFVFTPTVRKLPSSQSYFTQQIFDNRSPLHTVNNVSFSFNSMTTRLNLHDWGLEALPRTAMTVARTLGYDAETLYLKRHSIKIPDKIQKSQNTATETVELLEQTSSTLFMNAMTQTDDVKIVPARRREFYRDFGAQFTPQTCVVGSQTSATYSDSSDLPLFKLIRQLNENQLQAVDDFVNLITEPTGNAGIDVYHKRSRLHEIYKTSQQPSDLSISFQRNSRSDRYDGMPQAPPPPSMLSFDDMYTPTEVKRERNRDPRFDSNRSRPYPHFGSHLEQIPNQNKSWNDSSSSTSSSSPKMKYYGRGGKRR